MTKLHSILASSSTRMNSEFSRLQGPNNREGSVEVTKGGRVSRLDSRPKARRYLALVLAARRIAKNGSLSAGEDPREEGQPPGAWPLDF